MTEFWMFVGTLVFGAIWLAVGPFVIEGTEYAVDHVGGFLVGMTPEEVNDARDFRENEE